MANQSTDPWTDEEIKTIRDVYPSRGVKGVMAVFNGTRTDGAIRKQAQILGVQRIWKTGKPRSVLPRKPREATPTDELFKPNAQIRPLSALDRIALREWGHITRTGQLRPLVRIEIPEAA